MEYRVLGPLTVLADGRPTKLGGRRPQLVLATLLSHANHTVSQDLLIENVWAGNPPEAAKSTLQSYVYGLRRELGADTILRLGDGYRVDVDVESFDAMRFEKLANGARDLLETDPNAASAQLSEALAMWTGAAYEGLDSNPTLLGEITRLEELRLAATETRIDAELILGHHLAVTGDLESLVRRHPLRERFRGQQMLALYRGGRQAEALRAYQEARLQLGDELGIEPSHELQNLEQRILEQDSTLDIQTEASQTGSGSFGGYEIESVIGVGEIATVYRARQHASQREVAFKVIQPEVAAQADFIRRFEPEAQAVAALDHPHIVPLDDFWRDPEGAYLVMPIMRGGNLDSAVGSGGWSLPRAVGVLDQVGSALIHAHRREVVHGNLKPSNVLLDSDGNAYLSDFATAVSPTGSTVTDTIECDIVGLARLAILLFTGVSSSPAWRPPSNLFDTRPDLPPELARVLARAINNDAATRYGRVEDLLRAIKQTSGTDIVPVSSSVEVDPEPARNPYKGLRAFQDADAEDFFGRDALVDELLGALSTNNVVAVVGPSGSGKSSVVRAGLIPALRAGSMDGSEKWLMTDMFPGSHPFEELEAALMRVAVDRPGDIVAEPTDERWLLRVTKQILPTDESILLLVIDQFEELFSTVRSEGSRRGFLDNLVAVASDERSRIKVVLSLRADFLDRPLAYSSFADVLGRGMVTVGPPTRDGLAQAISAPARSLGVEVESGLSSRIISDIENQPGALPLLQFVLTELFEARSGPGLSIEGYEATGGVRRALGRRAEEVFAGMSEPMQMSSRQVFLRLVNITDDNETTRRRVSQAELRDLAIEDDAIDQVLGHFGRLRLLTFDREPISRAPTVELAHEALLSEWGRLRGWVEDAREHLQVARRISGLTHDWVSNGRDPSFLLRGARLNQAEGSLTSSDLARTAEEEEFIKVSMETELAEERGSRRRRRFAIVSLAAALGVTASLAVAAFWQWGVAKDEARQTVVRGLASDSLGAIDSDPELALLLAIESADVSLQAGAPLDVTTTAALTAALQSSRIDHLLAGKPRSVEFAGSLLITITDRGAISAESALDGSHQWTIDNGAYANDIVASPDGSLLAAVHRADANSEVVLWGVDGPSEVARIPVQAFSSNVKVVWSDDGRILSILAIANEDAEVTMVRVGESTPMSRFTVPMSRNIVALRGGGIALSHATTGMVSFYEADGQPIGEPLETPGFSPGPLAFDSTRNLLVIGSADGKRAQVFDLSTREVVWEASLPNTGAGNVSMDVSEATGNMAISGSGGSVFMYDLEDGTEYFTLRGHHGNVEDVDFDATGLQLATSANGESGRLWDVSGGGIGSATAGPEAPCRLLISPDGTLVAITGTDGTFSLVNVEHSLVLRSIPDQQIHYGAQVVASGDFELMSWVDGEGIGRAWDVKSGDAVAELPPCHSPKALSHDGSMAITNVGCSSDVSGSLIDTVTGRELLSFGKGEVWEAHFTSGGTADADRFAVINWYDKIEIFNTDDRELVAVIEAPSGDFFVSNAVDPDGRHLALGSEKGIATVYSLSALVSGSSPVEATVLTLPLGPVLYGIAIHGEYLAASTHGMLAVYELESGTLVARPEVEIETPPFTVFSPDGRSLLYADGGYVMKRLILDPGDLVEEARERVTRELTPEECNTYLGPGQCAPNKDPELQT